MSFSRFSKDFTANMYTSVENQFISNYLPHAGGDAVRVYLYGLYLCSCQEDFDGENLAQVLKIPLPKIIEIFSFWEDCDLVRILSRSPLMVEYLPVSGAVGRPKTVRPEKYADFNRELFKILQKAGKDFGSYDMRKILEFLETNPMEQQAFLLVAQYCAEKDGDKISCRHILNKANKLCQERKYTFEQVEQSFSDYNVHEKDLSKIFSALSIYRKPQESDYDLLEKWLAAGMETKAILATAQSMKKGTMPTLDTLISELCERDARTEEAAKEYLVLRERLVAVVFKAAGKLGVKVQNPLPYIAEYAEKWFERGYDEESVSLLASLGMKFSYGFAELDGLLDELYGAGIVDISSVKEYCTAQEKQLKLLQKIQSACGVVKKTKSAIEMLAAWQSWGFTDDMILEAAKLSANVKSPLPYMNKILSEWKRAGAFSPKEIPERTPTAPTQKAYPAYQSEVAIAADKNTERERFYAARRNTAIAEAEKAKRFAEQDEAYRSADRLIKQTQIQILKAERTAPNTLTDLQRTLEEARLSRAQALKRLNLTEDDFTPKYACMKCSDTGYMADGTPCDCYQA